MNWVITWLRDRMCCLFFFFFFFFCVSLWHGLWEEDSIISSVFWVLCVVLPVSYNGNRMRYPFWLSSDEFQPRSLQVSHPLFWGQKMWKERVCVTQLQKLVSLSQITRGYGAARYCGQGRGLFVEYLQGNSKYCKKMFQRSCWRLGRMSWDVIIWNWAQQYTFKYQKSLCKPWDQLLRR